MLPSLRTAPLVLWGLATVGLAQTTGGVWEDSWKFTGNHLNSQLGHVVINAGDLDGDGLDDLVIGDPGDPTGNQSAGSLEVRSSATGALIWQVVGARYQGYLGTSACLVGDVDGDGVTDLLVGEPRNQNYPGNAFLLSGLNGSTIGKISGTSSGDRFGQGLCSMGDLDSDGVPDFAISSPGTKGISSGYVELFSGLTRSTLGTIQASHLLNFGESITSIDDVDGDALRELLISGSGSSSSGQTDEVHLVSGGTGLVIHQQNSFASGDFENTTLLGIGDVDGDGISEYSIGAPEVDPGLGPNTGQVVTYSGATGAEIWRRNGNLPLGFAGTSLAVLPDQNADGTPDVLVGQPFTGTDTERGVFVVSGLNGEVLRKLKYHSPGSYSHFGQSITSLGLSPNGGSLIAVGAPHSNPNFAAPGETHLFEWNPILTTNRSNLSAGAGGTVILSMDFPDSEGGKAFGLLLSAHGTGPAVVNGVEIPLHRDWMFQDSSQGIYSPFFINPVGALDVVGRASVTFDAVRSGLANQTDKQYWAAVVSLDSTSSLPVISSVAASLLIEEPQPVLSVPTLFAGQVASLQLSNAYPLEMAFFLHGDGPGNDPFLGLGIADSGLTNPQLVGAAFTDISGNASQDFSVPAGTTGQTYWLAAHVNSGALTIFDVSGPHVAQ